MTEHRGRHQCQGTRTRVDGTAYRCPLRLFTPGRTLCGRCEMAVEFFGEDAVRWHEPTRPHQFIRTWLRNRFGGES